MSAVRDKDMRDWLVKETGGRVTIEVLYPQAVIPPVSLSPSCELGGVLVEIFGRFPSVG